MENRDREFESVFWDKLLKEGILLNGSGGNRRDWAAFNDNLPTYLDEGLLSPKTFHHNIPIRWKEGIETHVLPALTSPYPSIRAHAALALGLDANPRWLPALLDLVYHDEDWYVRHAAILAIGELEIPEKEAISVLQEISLRSLEGENQSIPPLTAPTVLARINSPRAWEALQLWLSQFKQFLAADLDEIPPYITGFLVKILCKQFFREEAKNHLVDLLMLPNLRHRLMAWEWMVKHRSIPGELLDDFIATLPPPPIFQLLRDLPEAIKTFSYPFHEFDAIKRYIAKWIGVHPEKRISIWKALLEMFDRVVHTEDMPVDRGWRIFAALWSFLVMDMKYVQADALSFLSSSSLPSWQESLILTTFGKTDRIPGVLRLLVDDSPRLRYFAAFTLISMVPSDPQFTETLLLSLADASKTGENLRTGAYLRFLARLLADPPEASPYFAISPNPEPRKLSPLLRDKLLKRIVPWIQADDAAIRLSAWECLVALHGGPPPPDLQTIFWSQLSKIRLERIPLPEKISIRGVGVDPLFLDPWFQTISLVFAMNAPKGAAFLFQLIQKNLNQMDSLEVDFLLLEALQDYFLKKSAQAQSALAAIALQKMGISCALRPSCRKMMEILCDFRLPGLLPLFYQLLLERRWGENIHKKALEAISFIFVTYHVDLDPNLFPPPPDVVQALCRIVEHSSYSWDVRSEALTLLRMWVPDETFERLLPASLLEEFEKFEEFKERELFSEEIDVDEYIRKIAEEPDPASVIWTLHRLLKGSLFEDSHTKTWYYRESAARYFPDWILKGWSFWEQVSELSELHPPFAFELFHPPGVRPLPIEDIQKALDLMYITHSRLFGFSNESFCMNCLRRGTLRSVLVEQKEFFITVCPVCERAVDLVRAPAVIGVIGGRLKTPIQCGERVFAPLIRGKVFLKWCFAEIDELLIVKGMWAWIYPRAIRKCIEGILHSPVFKEKDPPLRNIWVEPGVHLNATTLRLLEQSLRLSPKSAPPEILQDLTRALHSNRTPDQTDETSD